MLNDIKNLLQFFAAAILFIAVVKTLEDNPDSMAVSVKDLAKKWSGIDG